MKALQVVAICSVLAWATATLRADDDQSIAVFGQGVHCYFDGQLDAAGKLLAEAIAENSVDPRPYYFLGLVHQQMGDAKQASGDFQKGAEVEWSYIGQSFDVDDALERVQGPVRLEIEKFRADAAARAKELRKAANADVDHSIPGAVSGTPLDPRNLPDVSSIVDATIPFPEISAKPYYPPAKSAADFQANPVLRPVAPTAKGAPPAAADDPFASGNPANKSADSGEMKEKEPAQDPPPADDDPFGGGNEKEGGEPDPNKDGGQQPEPKQGEGDKPDSKDDPFGGG